MDTDTRVGPNVDHKENPNREIPTIDLGLGDAHTGFLEYMEMGPDGATARKIRELNDLTSRQPSIAKEDPSRIRF